MKKIDIITLFPEAFDSYLSASLMKRATEKKILKVRAIALRDFAEGKHRTTDLPPYGGGPGMVLKPEPIWKAVEFAKKAKAKKNRVILFSLRGKKFTQAEAKRLSKYDQLIFICGRYEGVDERVAEHLADEELSIGDYVLAGGELPALVVAEAVARHYPGFLGKEESREDVKGSYPVYTRPAVFEAKVKGKKKKMEVPEVLQKGNHAEIKKWRDS
jgi:tRNA (guanine37-N1)-methyltransferase